MKSGVCSRHGVFAVNSEFDNCPKCNIRISELAAQGDSFDLGFLKALELVGAWAKINNYEGLAGTLQVDYEDLENRLKELTK